MNERKLTDFGLSVKTELLRRGKTQKWLEDAVSGKTGQYIDHGYMYKILTGRRTPADIMSAIREILEMEVTTHVEAPENTCAAAERSE